MQKDKKLAGCFPFISNDETLLATFSRNTVYIHSLETKKRILKFKSLSNIDYVAISTNQQKIAVKNTSGIIQAYNIDESKLIPEFFNNGKEYVISTWSGTFVGEI